MEQRTNFFWIRQSL